MYHSHTLEEEKRGFFFPFSWQKHNFRSLLSKSIWVSGQEFVKNAEKPGSFLLYKC